MRAHVMKNAQRCVSWLLLAALVGHAGMLDAQATSDPALQSFVEWAQRRNLLRSPSGRFQVFGDDIRNNMDVMLWAERVAGRLEHLTGVTLDFRHRVRICFVLGESADGIGRYRDRVDATFRFWIQMPPYDVVPVQEVERALVFALLDGWIAAGTGDLHAAAPDWLREGLYGNLSAVEKDRSRDRTLVAWHEGRLPHPAELLHPASAGGVQDPAFSVMLVAWLLEGPGREQRMQQLLDMLQAGGTVTPELFSRVKIGSRLVADLEEAWDVWLLRQERIVFKPGHPSWIVWRRLEAERLLYPGTSGIPLDAEIPGGALWPVLLDSREASWLAEFVREKRFTLQLLAVGRGERFAGVMEAYTAFLQGLINGMTEDELLHLWEHAEQERKRLSVHDSTR